LERVSSEQENKSPKKFSEPLSMMIDLKKKERGKNENILKFKIAPKDFSVRRKKQSNLCLKFRKERLREDMLLFLFRGSSKRDSR
jgi:hypothetical protein